MPGENGTQVSGSAAELEQTVLASWPELTEVLVSDRVQASRRSLRLNVAGLEWGLANGELELSFVLPPGAYATTVLREVLIATEAERI
jgi:tRNA pseudouridine13 synthase